VTEVNAIRVMEKAEPYFESVKSNSGKNRMVGGKIRQIKEEKPIK